MAVEVSRYGRVVTAEGDDVPAVPRVHLDAASGLPLHPRAREAWLSAVDHGWADPLRLHAEGRAARLLIDNAREAIAEVVGCRADELSFTSSGTTACHAAVLGLAKGRRRVGQTIVHSAVEHSAVLHAAESAGGPNVEVGVDAFGRIDLGSWAESVAADDVALACLQHANHEVGTTQSLDVAADACEASDVPLVVDASASLGWIDPPAFGDVVVASGHKFGGPAGVGILVVRKGTRWRAPGPVDDRDERVPGFTDVPSVLATAAALQAVDAARPVSNDTMHRMTAELRREVLATIPDVDIAGHPELRLPHIVNFSCLYVEGEALVTELDRQGFSVSSGSACTASSLTPSHVLAAMGVLTHGNVRVSISPATTIEDLWRFVDAVAAAVPRLRAATGMAPPPPVGTGRHRGTDA